jgi:8-oxo-dGTP diphosphatase
MRRWLVAGAVIEGPEGVLLVQNRRRDGRVDWSPPGGVVDEGETVLEGLTREVAEETGLVVASWEGPIYEIEAEAPDLGWHLRVEVHRAVAIAGVLALADPDGIVVDACYVAAGECSGHLRGAPMWVRDPLGAWLGERWQGSRSFRYRVEGTDPASLRVSSVP